jgi:hypothetical protein
MGGNIYLVPRMQLEYPKVRLSEQKDYGTKKHPESVASMGQRRAIATPGRTVRVRNERHHGMETNHG